MYARHLAPLVSEALTDTPVVFLAGARQVGKSTLARALAEGPDPARYLTLDDPPVQAAAGEDPAGFVAGLEGPVVLDEVQRAPGLARAIKASVDRDRRPGRFLLTGSANILLLPEIAEALVGRMEVITLWPLSQGEIEGRKETFVDAVFEGDDLTGARPVPPKELVLRIARGGFPEAVSRARADRRRAWLESYAATMVSREARELAAIERTGDLNRLLALVAARSSGLMNAAELSRATELPQTTLKRYLALLETMLLVHPRPAWSGNLGKRLIKSPKADLVDVGLAAALTGGSESRLLDSPTLLGALAESMVAVELRKQAGWSRTRPRVFHFRSAGGTEVDVVLEDAAGRVVGVEVKISATITGRDVSGLRALAEALGKRYVRGILLYAGSETVPFAPNLLAVPLSRLWE